MTIPPFFSQIADREVMSLGAKFIEDRNFGLQIFRIGAAHQRHSRQVQCLPYVVYA
jgi:hypothetical protein